MQYQAIHYARRLRVARDAAEDEAVLMRARDILMRRMRAPGHAAGSPTAMREYLTLTLGALEHEEFWAIWLDAQNRVIAAQQLFRGSVRETIVYPREVAKAALHHNAAAVIFAHNHPSGVAEPSRADEALTASLRSALMLFDIQTLDHFIIGGDKIVSFAERGLL